MQIHSPVDSAVSVARHVGLWLTGLLGSGAHMDSRYWTTTPSSPTRAGAAEYAENPPSRGDHLLSITPTKTVNGGPSEVFSASFATRESLAPAPLKFLSEPPLTSQIRRRYRLSGEQ